MTADIHLPFTLPSAAGHHAIYEAAAPDYVSIYVEGPRDVDLWANWLVWRPRHAGNRIEVLKQIDELQASGFACVGIIDADFDYLQGTVTSGPNLITTSGRDIECDLLRSPVLDRFLSSIGEHVIDTEAVRRHLLDSGLLFGALRWIFHRRKVAFPDGRLTPFTFMDKATGCVDRDRLEQAAAAALHISTEVLRGEFQLVVSQAQPDPWKCCNGHDLVDILTAILQGPLGCKRLYPRSDLVANHLRVSVGAEHLAELQIWRSMEDWENRNFGKKLRKLRYF